MTPTLHREWSAGLQAGGVLCAPVVMLHCSGQLPGWRVPIFAHLATQQYMESVCCTNAGVVMFD